MEFVQWSVSTAEYYHDYYLPWIFYTLLRIMRIARIYRNTRDTDLQSIQKYLQSEIFMRMETIFLIIIIARYV